MKKILVLGLTLSMILLGGCGVETNEVKTAQAEQEQKRPKDMDPKDLPQVTAFQDEKTREFMVSTKEEEPGYYLLEGKTKKFRMLFPEKGKYINVTSSYRNENEEVIGFYSYEEDNNIKFDMQVSYYKDRSFVSKINIIQEIVSGKNGYKGEYQKSKINDLEIYSASMKTVYDDIDSKYNFDYSYFGFIKPIKDSTQGMEYSATFSCVKDDKECKLEEKEMLDKLNNIIYSIQFLGNEKE
jgi:hypothetical protein